MVTVSVSREKPHPRTSAFFTKVDHCRLQSVQNVVLILIPTPWNGGRVFYLPYETNVRNRGYRHHRK
jgi:hypothetical protein